MFTGLFTKYGQLFHSYHLVMKNIIETLIFEFLLLIMSILKEICVFKYLDFLFHLECILSVAQIHFFFMKTTYFAANC